MIDRRRAHWRSAAALISIVTMVLDRAALSIRPAVLGTVGSWMALAVLSAVVWPQAAIGQQARLQSVLILLSLRSTAPSVANVEIAFRRTLEKTLASPVDLHIEYLDLPNQLPTSYLRRLTDLLADKYAGRSIDVVVVQRIEALDYLLKNREALFSGVPIVFTEVTPEELLSLHPPHDVTGVLRIGGSRTVAVALDLLPDTRHVAIVGGASAVDRQNGAYARELVQARDSGLDVVRLDGLALDDQLRRVASLPPHSVVIFTSFRADNMGRSMVAREVLRVVARAANAPTFGSADTWLGYGIVGGDLIQFDVLTERAAALTARLLKGEKPSSLAPVAEPASAFMFDWRELRRWGIDERDLPAGSVVLFREPSLWRDRRPLVITVIAVTLAQTLLIIGLVFEHVRRQRAELESRRNLTAMAHLDRRVAIGELATSLAHEINQPLNAILQNAEAAEMMLKAGSGPPPVDDLLDILHDIQEDDTRAGDVIQGMRTMLQKHELEMTPLDVNAFARETVNLTLPEAVSRGVQMDLELADGLPRIQGDRVHLQQVLLNLLLNGMDAVADTPPDRRRLRVRSVQRDGQVELAVTDSGAGFAEGSLSQVFESFFTTKGHGLGMGLSIARRIIEVHGGRIGAENNAEGGATVWFRLPAQL